MLLNELSRFLTEEDGTEAIEWAVVALVILGFTVAAVLAVGGQLRVLLCNMLVSLGGDPGSAQCPTS